LCRKVKFILVETVLFTGQTVKWEWVLNKSQLDLTPPKYDLAEKFPVAPVPVPGKDELV